MEILDTQVRIDPERRRQRFCVEVAREGLAVPSDILQEPVGLVAGEMPREAFDNRRLPLRDVFEHVLAQRAGLPVLQNRELRRDAGFQRKPPQQ